ncbi:glycosyltransferase [Myroides marinus]|uniref:glycosyltransferase n=1 Tax=Myroides marinus TaxID=703342 RepID=UPI002578698B|nr:glycosyltransferase [Myroides marinus]MDM1370041.1 glycosyltransferase [Myroides marinus]MDM1534080.1 glycosyltransferase [Myroides marinus]MDM1541044.1 glycosyltransferase [Myroides marinus]
MNKIKVLLASYNGSKYIIEQVKSILNQEGVVVDLEIRDDSSTDDTIDKINKLYFGIKSNVNYPGTGSAACNFFKMIESLDFGEEFEYIAFADQDDVWLPQKLKIAVDKLEESNSVLYCSNLTKWDMNTGEYSLLKKNYKQEKFDFLFEGGSAGCTYVFKREFAIEVQELLKKIDYLNWNNLSHDWLIYFYARLLKLPVYIDSNSQIHYRLHSSNVHGHLNKLSYRAIREKLSQVLNGYHIKAAEQFVSIVPNSSEEYKIYEAFLGGYWKRNRMIWKYNTSLMRDKKKLFAFMFLNLLK